MVPLRLAVLSAEVAVRSLGPVPWLVSAAYVATAMVQEPTILRASGIHLGPQSIWNVAAVLLLLLASQLRSVRHASAHLASALLLTLAMAAVLWCASRATEWIAPSPFPEAAISITMFIISYLPAAICISLASQSATFGAVAHCIVQLLLALDAAHADVCSTNQVVARIACGIAAWAATTARCAQKA